MKRTWLTGLLAATTAALLAVMLTETIHAQGGAPPTGRIACVDVLRVRNEYQRYKDLIEEGNTHEKRLQDEERTRRDKLEKMDAELSALRPDDTTRAERTRQWMTQQIDYKNWGEMAKLAFAREFGLWSSEVYKDVYETSGAIGQQGGYDLVLFREDFAPASLDPAALENQVRMHNVIYASAAVDITQLVLDRLNAEYRAKPQQPMMQIP